MLSNDHSLFDKAVFQVLGDASLPRSVVAAIAHAFHGARRGFREDVAALKEIIGEEDFDWPWFDEWLATFSTDRKWPSFPAWSWFDGAPKPIKTVKGVLNRLTVSSIKSLAKEKSIPVDSGLKVDELRTVMARKFRWPDVEAIAQGMNEEDAAKYAATIHTKKLEILAITIIFRMNALLRHSQIAVLLGDQAQGNTAFRYKPVIEPDDNSISRRLSKLFVFDPHDTESLPPFFPGDRSSLGTARTGRR